MAAGKSADQYSRILVARYLREHGFKDTLKAFSRECSQSFQEFTDEQAYVEPLEKIVSERIAFAGKEVAEQLKRLAVEDPVDAGYQDVVRFHNARFRPVESIVGKTSLAIGAHFCGIEDSLFLSYADRMVDRYDGRWRLEDKLDVSQEKFGAVKLCGTILDSQIYYFCGLDGSFVAYEDAGPKLHCRLHERMVTHIQFFTLESGKSWLIVSCGLDNCLRVHRLVATRNSIWLESIASEKQLSACTSLLVASQSSEVLAFVTRADHTHVLCYRIAYDDHKLVLSYRIALNTAEFSTFSFNARDMVFVGQKDKDGTPVVGEGCSLLVATSHVPYMRLIQVEIPLQVKDPTSTLYSQIIRNVPTEVEQDTYSEPILKLVPYSNEVLVGNSSGVYATCILTGRSRLLDLPVPRGSRVKCLDVSRDGRKLIVGLADKTVAAFDVVI
ncbi:hypothetical protein HG536_0C02310 [Torulaspora globosa]|uniref:Uncharacterized protein n=1 Tax=Torulaspora globosa TaxID=48254 RepID=A0A7G3ZEX6_9SACH|nr:uncharacterized protein HG536_0C02310 [Torulaspora globosa]QLL32062.1 hypothetical protein HG536_0C02310 [Torulaspora globosa]